MGGNEPYPEPEAPIERQMPDAMAFLPLMMEQIGQSMEMMMMVATQQPEPPPLPEIFREPTIDWSKKQEELASKMRADYGLESARRHGRPQTLHTSPLLDEEEPELTSLLTD